MYSEISKAVEIINSGGIILYPTDTIWGIGCDATNEEAIRKVYHLKNRTDAKSLIILLADEEDIFQYVSHPVSEIITVLKGFEEITTVIYEHAKNLPQRLIAVDGSIAIRITKDPFCKELIRRIGKPLVSTSANISGHTSPATYSEIDSEIKTGVDYIVRHRQNDIQRRPASRIVKVNPDGSLNIIRT